MGARLACRPRERLHPLLQPELGLWWPTVLCLLWFVPARKRRLKQPGPRDLRQRPPRLR